MRRLQARVLVGLFGVLTVFAEGSGRGEKPAPTVQGGTKPPWQRLLQGDDARKADAQERQLEQLQTAGKFDDALKVAETLAKLRTKAQGANHWQTVNARWDLEAVNRVLRQGKEGRDDYARSFLLWAKAQALESKGQFREAQGLRQKTLAIWQKVLGEDHPNTASSYNAVANNLSVQGRYSEAGEGYGKALAIYRKALGEDHPNTATGYINVASNLHNRGKYAEAEPIFRKALSIFRKVLGEEHPDTAAGYNNLAFNLFDQGKYAEAESVFRKALAIKQKVLGGEHPSTATGYGGLGYSLLAQGKYAEAEALFRVGLTISRRVLGEEHSNTAAGYTGLAATLQAQGKYAEAEPFFRKSLTISRRVLGEEHSVTAERYDNVGSTLQAQGRYAEAEALFRKGLSISRKVLGEEHPSTAQSFNNLAANLSAQGKFAEAEPLLRKALALKQKLLGKEHPSTVLSYNNVASNLDAQGKYAEAETLSRKALAIRRKVLGEEHPDTAQSYDNVAINLDHQGGYAGAEPLLRKALAIRQKLLGEDHPETAQSYYSLAVHLWLQGKGAEAEKFGQRGADCFAKTRLRIATAGLDRATKTGERSPLAILAAVLARNGKREEAWRRFEEGLGRGTWDDLSARLRRPQAEQAKQAQLVARLHRFDQSLERLSAIKKPTLAQTHQYEELLTQHRQAQDELDAFGRYLEKTYGPVAGAVFDRKVIQAALPPDAALLGWLDIPGAPKAHDPNGEHWAVLLRSAGDPIFVRLKGSGLKDAWTDADTRLPAQLRAALQTARGDWQPLARRLRQQRLQPLTPHLAAHDKLPAVKHLLVLPSAALAGVPVEVFADGYTVSYALSGTFYAHLRKQSKPDSTSLLALGDPVFDVPAVADKPLPLPPGGVLLTVVAPGSNAARARLQANDVLLRYGDTDLKELPDLLKALSQPGRTGDVLVIVWREGKTFIRHVQPGKLGVVLAREPAPQALAERRKQARQLASALRGGDGDKWDALPGTRAEVEALRRLFDGKLRLLFDSQASEQRLDELAASGELSEYRYLHLATHGIVDNRFPLNSAVILSRDALPDPNKQLDAGLPVYNGKLTAEAVLRRWHLKSELVTLSACQTALGKYERGEGFVGFAQALMLAGSRSVCLSLWKVDDAATALLMERFYQNLLGKRAGLKKPLSRAQALAEAKAWLRGLSREEALKRMAGLTEGVARGKGRKVEKLLPPLPTGGKEDRPYAHPYYWAAFVLLGDPN